METTPLDDGYEHLSNAGVGPSLVWSGPDQGMSAHEDLGYEVDGDIAPLATISGFTDVQVEVDIPSQRYSVFTNGSSVGTDIQFSQDIDAIDTLRMFTWDLATENFATRSFHYVILEKLGQTNPEISIVEAPSDDAYSYFCGVK